MDPQVAATLWHETLRIVRMLVAGDYDGIASITAGERLSAAELRTAVEEFGVPLEVPPTPEGARFRPLRVTDSNPSRWSITCDLWSSGRPSDLTLELTLRGPVDGRFAIDFDDLRVL